MLFFVQITVTFADIYDDVIKMSRGSTGMRRDGLRDMPYGAEKRSREGRWTLRG